MPYYLSHIQGTKDVSPLCTDKTDNFQLATNICQINKLVHVTPLRPLDLNMERWIPDSVVGYISECYLLWHRNLCCICIQINLLK